MPQLTDPFSHRTATRPLDLYPAPHEVSPDTRRQRRLVSVIVALGCVVTLALAVLLGTSGRSREGTGPAAPAPETTATATDPAEPPGARTDPGPADEAAPAPAGGGLDSAQPVPQDQPGTSAPAEPTTEPTDPPGQHWATVRIVEPSRLTIPAGEPASLWATATLEDGTPVANSKLRWRIWSEPEHALVLGHQGWHVVTPGLPAGRYTVVISVVDAKVSGGLKRTLVVEEDLGLAQPTATPTLVGPGVIKP